MKRILALESVDDTPENMDTQEQVVDPKAAADEADAEDPNAPLELPDMTTLKVDELQELNEAELSENKERVDAIGVDAPEVLSHLDKALEHFIVSCGTKKVKSLRLAAEELDTAQELGGANILVAVEPEE